MRLHIAYEPAPPTLSGSSALWRNDVLEIRDGDIRFLSGTATLGYSYGTKMKHAR